MLQFLEGFILFSLAVSHGDAKPNVVIIMADDMVSQI